MDSEPFGGDLNFTLRGSFGKARSQLSQFCDFFSDFSRHIAPAYHHDRCERYSIISYSYLEFFFFFILIFFLFFFFNLKIVNRSVQMRLYSMHKREFGLVFLAFFACIGVGVFIGLAGNYIVCIGQVYRLKRSYNNCKCSFYRSSNNFDHPSKYFQS